ncbi:RdgB/HAM1 family non-canonical purine NTP pyrophosphatase [Salinispirillum sp. LH 10-3-1]|uniref:dITP/XTP pyrophosphatase n=1 Tax=Salinispirillum sp. LH 10-3-1 TaxID=2952525 RepID=A0AB38YG99_9GAMM
MSNQLVLASGNAGKLSEFQGLLQDLQIEVKPQSDFRVSDAEETGLTFIENAILKARHAARITGLPALADDSGLEVDFLNGAPGIYSARYSGTHGDNAGHIAKVLTELEGVPEAQRTARFVCVLALLRHGDDPRPLICQGTWEGRILAVPQGDGGFGYDPIFYVPEHHCSAAELPQDIKNRLSHRGQASALFRAALSDWLSSPA